MIILEDMSILYENKSWLVKTTATITSGVYAILSMIAMWVDFTSFFAYSSLTYRILLSLGVFAGIALFSFAACLLYLKFKKRFTVYKSETGHIISIQFGDILNTHDIPSDNRICSIVVPVNRCFDTRVDDRLIASSSLHGKFLSFLIANNHFSPDSLNQQIQKSLIGKPFVTLTKDDKSEGNFKRYPAGTVVCIDAGKKRFFLLGLSSFDTDLKATTSKEDYSIAIQKLIEFCDSNAQGGEVFFPLIGTGLSRVGISKNDVLHYLYHTVVLNKEHLNFDLTIFIPESERRNVSLTNYK